MKVTWPSSASFIERKAFTGVSLRRKEGGGRKPGFWLLISSGEPPTLLLAVLSAGRLIPVLPLLGHRDEIRVP